MNNSNFRIKGGFFQILTLLVCFFLAGLGYAQEEQNRPDEEKQLTKLMQEGQDFLTAKNMENAIERFDEVIAFYEKPSDSPKTKLYCARTQPETLLYLLEAANNQEAAVVHSELCTYAYYYKAYALADLGQFDKAKAALLRGIERSPQNALFHSELGHIFQVEKNWPAAFESFQRAAQAAQEFSPEDLKVDELTRAWRGIGFALIEMGKLDEAEQMYTKCLQLNPEDKMAAQELGYIKSIREKAKTP